MVSVNKTVPHSMRTKTDRRADCFPIEEPPSLHTLTSIWLDTFSPSRWTMFVKRSADIFFSLFGLILGAPVLLLCAVVIRLDSPGPVFYRQERLTRNEQPFQIYKFRTMIHEAEKDTGCILASVDDPRITHVGKLLRAVHLDELPQLFNVLKGEMSLVGPRPERPHFVKEYKKTVNQYQRRFSVRAGMTGVAQVYGHYYTNAADKTFYDLWYLNHFSIWQDIALIGMTAKRLLG